MRFLAIAIAFACTGCTGLSLGLNTPGAPAHVGSGSLAVDDRTDTAFVLAEQRTANGMERRLYAVPPDGPPVHVASSTHGRDQRLLFPDAGVLLMSETATGGEELTLFDRTTFAERRSAKVSSRYGGTRVSPTGKWIAVADNDEDALPIHVIDPRTLRVRPIPHGGTWLEATWLADRDVLVAAIFDGGVRIAAWSMDGVRARAFETDETGAWSEPELDIRIENKTHDVSLSFTWITSSSDGRWIVVPLRDGATKAHQLVLLDTKVKTHRIIDDAKGPVGFTGDDSTIVSYAAASKEADEIVLIDVATLEKRAVPVPRIDRFNFHVLDSTVTVAPTSAAPGSPREREQHSPLFVFDAHGHDPGVVIEPARAHLDEFVERPLDHDLWLVSHGMLNRIDMSQRTLELVDLGFRPEHVNHLPTRDLLVLDQHSPGHRSAPAGLVFWDPDRREVQRRVELRL